MRIYFRGRYFIFGAARMFVLLGWFAAAHKTNVQSGRQCNNDVVLFKKINTNNEKKRKKKKTQ